MARDQTNQFLTDLAEARRKKKRRHDSPKTPHGSPPPPPPSGPSGTSGSLIESGSSQVSPPPPSTNQEGQSHGSTTPSSLKTVASAEYTAWTTSDTRFNPSLSSIPEDLHMDDDSALDEQVHLFDDEDIRNDHIPKVNLIQDWWKPLSEEDRPATPEPAWSIPSSDLPVLVNNWASAFASTYAPPSKNSQLLTDKVDDALIRYNISQPLPLGGQPGQVTIQTNFFFYKYLEYLRYGSKGSRPALSISKMKATYYPDVGLEQMVPDQMWIEEECKYDIAVIIEVLSLYGYGYTKKIVLRRAGLKEYIIAKRDFKYLYPSDIEDLHLLNLQEDFQLGIESYQTQLNLTKPRWDATGFEYKHDFTVIESPRAVTFMDKYKGQGIKVNRMNPGLNTRFWTKKDVDRSKEFMFAIQKRLKTKRIFRNLESFVGRRVREALAAAGKEAEWLKKFILEIPLWSKPITPISALCDSVAILAKAYSQMYNGKSRHLGVRHNMILEFIMNGVVSIKFVRS
nr:zinc finger, CCHC-type [Tanacetum cinerariifolium]GEY73089.1 zinc finger, CCHC-type [Tanacetum cinerariifolium]